RRLDPAAPPRRRYLAILDGIVAGHRESPLAPSPLPAGLLMGAFNPLALDAVATAMMGLDVRKVPQISRAFALSSFPLAAFELEDIRILSDLGIATIGDIYRNGAYLRSEPSAGFRGHVEYRGSAEMLGAPAPSSDVAIVRESLVEAR